MVEKKNTSAVIVTRGDIDLSRVVKSLEGFRQIVVWNNLDQPDCSVFGRFMALEFMARSNPVYVQDDDCIVLDHSPILEGWQPGTICANFPKGHRKNYLDGIALVGFGALIDRGVAREAICRYLSAWPLIDPLFLDECDRVVTALSEVISVEAPYENLTWAHDPRRMGSSSDHSENLRRIRERIEAVRKEELFR